MGRDPREGLCDEYGEVFGHPGLYVVDGALLPGPVGANPSLTIAAVADRGCTHLLESNRGPVRHGPGTEPWSVRQPLIGSAAGAERALLDQRASGLQFTEQMKGFAALGVHDPEAGPSSGARTTATG